MRAPATPEAPLGCLYIVATPIGNLEDISLRALRILREADLIACEDTRRTQKLLNHYEIQNRTVSYHEHNELRRAPELVLEMEQSARVALVSDAGTPLVSDPGYRLVSLCVRHHIPVIPIPGPSALVAALTASGLPNDEFVFGGFLPARAGERRAMLERLRSERRTLVLYEAPHRVVETLHEAADILGDRAACVAREVTKLHEEFHRGRLSKLAEEAGKQNLRGEITILIGPPDELSQAETKADSQTLGSRVEELMRDGAVDRKSALKQAARERGMTHREAYKQLLAGKPKPA